VKVSRATPVWRSALVGGLLLASILGGIQDSPTAPETPTESRKACFRNLTATQWAEEIQTWEPCCIGYSSIWGRETIWLRNEKPGWFTTLAARSTTTGGDKLECLELLEGDPQAEPVLLSLAHDKDVKVRRAAVTGLGRLRTKSSLVLATLERARSDPDEDLHWDAEQALGNRNVPPKRVYAREK
jgi:hypothetical protein